MVFTITPPDFFPETEADRWHAHAGLCVTMWDQGSGPEWIVNQHMTNAECQALPNLAKVEFNGQIFNLWAHFWMKHAWLFDLNPNGVFGNVHSCIDQDAASEHEINGGVMYHHFFSIMSNVIKV